MYDEKEFKLIKKFKYKDQLYYFLTAIDGDIYFLKDKDGSFDYLEYNEYCDVEKYVLDRKKALTFYFAETNKDNLYTITYSNTPYDKKPKKFKTCKYVYYKGIITPIVAAFILAGVITSAIFTNRYLFDKNLSPDALAKYGVQSSYALSLQNENDDFRYYYVDKVDPHAFPMFSKVITKDNFPIAMDVVSYEEFCQKMDLKTPTKQDLYEAIDRIELYNVDKQILRDIIDDILSKNPDIDLRVLLNNLQSVTSSYGAFFGYTPTTNTLSLDLIDYSESGVETINPEEYEDLKTSDPDIYNYRKDLLYHELFHMIHNSYSQKENLLLTEYSPCVIFSNNGISMRYNFGNSYEEYKADVFLANNTGMNLEDAGNYYSIAECFLTYMTLYCPEQTTDISFRELIEIVKSKTTDKAFNQFVYDILDLDDLFEPYAEPYLVFLDEYESRLKVVVDSFFDMGLSADEIKGRFSLLFSKMQQQFPTLTFFNWENGTEQNISEISNSIIEYIYSKTNFKKSGL